MWELLRIYEIIFSLLREYEIIPPKMMCNVSFTSKRWIKSDSF